MSWISHSFSFLAVLPFIPFIIVWLLMKFFTNDDKKRLKLAMDVTTLFLIASVAGLCNVVFGTMNMMLYGILLIMLITAGLIGGARYRRYGKVNALRLFRTVWRISFFVLSLLYILLLLIGIIIYIYKI